MVKSTEWRGPSLPGDHPCGAAFLDETGAIAKDRFFAVGLIKVREPAELLRRFDKLRDQNHWYSEMHFYDFKPRDMNLYKAFIDVALAPGMLDFFCFVADRNIADPIVDFNTPWDAYGRLAEQLVFASIRPGELLSVMADKYSTPPGVQFEETLRTNVNQRAARLAVVSACRLDSKSCDGLQIVDLLTSAVTQEFRAAAGLASHTSPKGKLAAYVRESLGARTCLNSWRNENHSVQIYRYRDYQKLIRRTVIPSRPKANVS